MGLFAPTENPLFRLHNIDVMELNPHERIVGLMIHIICWEHELQSPSVKQKVNQSVKWALDYLMSEGFITSPINGWNKVVAVIGHSPKE